ncbi:MAG: penicillin-binding protein activator LpoB [Spirochaetales bacterium]|jgi:TolB-like protein|nr:penicillin-binding protein activator LpoB [Spirochaetales bacterium]
MKKALILLLAVFGAALLSAQNSLSLEEAIPDAVDFFSSRLPQDSVVAIANIEAENEEISDFVIEELTVALSNLGSLRIVERARLEDAMGELEFQASGMVDEATAHAFGEMLGAQFVFSGSLAPYRDRYRLRLQAINIATGQITGTRTVNVHYDPTLTGLLGRIDPAEGWKYNWVYVGVNVGYSVMTGEGYDTMDWGYDSHDTAAPLGYALYALFQPFDFFGIALDVGGNVGLGLAIAIAPTLTLRFNQFEVDVFFGGGIGLSGYFAFMGGVRGGMHLGPGVIFAEIRPQGQESYLDTNITLGYQVGFIPRKK